MRLLFWRKRTTAPPVADERTLTDDLRDYLLKASCCGPEGRSHWVMSVEWLAECRKLTNWNPSLFAPTPSRDMPLLLFGKPITIREDGGAPHLEAT